LERLAELANDMRVARYLRRRFPHPYTKNDAADWLSLVCHDGDSTYFAIEVDGRLAGGIGVEPLAGEHEGVADFGYWLGHDFWGRGIATAAARNVVRHAFETLDPRRLEAPVMAANVASARVLEKAGFIRECELRSWYVDREGAIHDGIMYRMTRSDYASTIGALRQRRQPGAAVL